MAFYWVLWGLVVKCTKFSEPASIPERKDDDIDFSHKNGKADSFNIWETKEAVSQFSF